MPRTLPASPGPAPGPTRQVTSTSYRRETVTRIVHWLMLTQGLRAELRVDLVWEPLLLWPQGLTGCGVEGKAVSCHREPPRTHPSWCAASACPCRGPGGEERRERQVGPGDAPSRPRDSTLLARGPRSLGDSVPCCPSHAHCKRATLVLLRLRIAIQGPTIQNTKQNIPAPTPSPNRPPAMATPPDTWAPSLAASPERFA